MQFNAARDGSLQPLPAPNIDTGAGFERLVAVLSGTRSNYDTDLFTPILDCLSGITGKVYRYSEDDDISLRICADHLRAAVFLISDAVVPSNEGRGYVLRKLLRRALQHGRRMGMLYGLIDLGHQASSILRIVRYHPLR